MELSKEKLDKLWNSAIAIREVVQSIVNQKYFIQVVAMEVNPPRGQTDKEIHILQVYELPEPRLIDQGDVRKGEKLLRATKFDSYREAMTEFAVRTYSLGDVITTGT